MTAPLALFADPALTERLVLRGLWHVRTFLDAEDCLDAPATAAALANLTQIHNLNGFAKIRPFSEVLLLPPENLDDAALSRYIATLRALAAHRLTMLIAPNADWPESWRTHLAAAFAPLMRQQIWLHLPKPLLERALAGLLADSSLSSDVAGSLEQLGLCGVASNRPPCFRAAV